MKRRSNMFLVGLGALFFGLIVGWIAYRVLRLRAGAPGLSDLIALLGVIAGAAVLAFFRNEVVLRW
jgi:xanthosine utilization system XapX-like protein